jgi:hypothetical protein
MENGSRALRTLLPVLVVLMVACVSPALADGEDAPSVGTLTGQVVIGPTCPGPVRVDRLDQCQDAPYAATLSIQTPDGAQELTQVTTDAQGQFTVDLDPGTYQLVPLSPPGRILPRGVPQTVDMAAGQVLSVIVQYDSGMR